MSLAYVEFPADGSSSLTCCQRACPVGTDVSSYIALVAQGRFAEALEVVREENPFPATCGRACDHVCEGHCRRAESDEPVAIRALKRFLADRERAGEPHWPARIEPWRPEKVAIVGAGPAGLTAAADLLRRGFQVRVFEALPAAGGMLRVGIPDYRLPPEVLEFDLEHLRRLGLEIALSAALGRDFTLSDLKTQGYDAVLLATGTHGSRPLQVPGADLPGVIPGIGFLRQVKLGEKPPIGRAVVVIGGGDVAMDTARTALRLGADRVDLFCLESRAEMPAHDWETREALDEQIRFHPGWGPVEFLGDDRVRQVRFVACTSVFDASGKFSPTFDPAVTTTVEADTVLPAIGQVAQFAHAPEDGIETTPGQLYRADGGLQQTTAPWVFAAGDAVHGTATIVQAVASGHRAAASIAEYLEGRPLTGRWEPVRRETRIERIEIPHGWEELPAAVEPELPACERVRSFAEVKLGLDEAAAIAEAARCLRCDHETDSFTYSRATREQVHQLARDLGDDEAERLAGLKRQLLAGRARPPAGERAASLGDLVFLPATLTRLVIDPYREPCNTRTVIGARAARSLELAGPVVIGGLPFSELAPDLVAALSYGAAQSGVGLRAPLDLVLPTKDAALIRVVPLGQPAGPVGAADAIELAPEAPHAPLDPDGLARALETYRALAPGVPIGITLGPDSVAANVRAAVAAGLDFATLWGAAAPSGWAEADGHPRIEVLTEAVEALRAINREEDLDLLYFGSVSGGGDAAKALALGATAVIIGQAAVIAAGAAPASDVGNEATDTAAAAECVAGFVRTMLMEASILARCCGKTDVHNLEPEDLRSLTVETSRATGAPLVGRNVTFRRGGTGRGDAS